MSLLGDPALRAVLDALPRARLVGGCVRDALADRPVADVDLATPDPPDDVIAALARAGLKSAPTGLQHGTVTAIADHRGFEVTTLRRDVATDGRHAEVAWTDDWQEDAARRDFTVNAMSMSRDGALFDYFGGADDLRDGRIRFVGDPAARIAEDYLRILRFFRFQARYGRHAPDGATLAALREGVDGLSILSPERIWSECKRILLAPDPAASLRLMAELGVLAAILPEVTGTAALERLIASGAPADPILRLAALAPGPGVADRWRLSTAERTALDALAGPAARIPDLQGPDLRRALADTSAPVLIGRSWLAQGADGGRSAGAFGDAGAPPRVRRWPGAMRWRSASRRGRSVGELVREVTSGAGGWQGGCVASSAAECRAELARRVASEAASKRRGRGMEGSASHRSIDVSTRPD